MSTTGDAKRVVDEWHYLQDRCSQAFAGLREASPFGRSFVGVFQKTFECYTRYRGPADRLLLFLASS